MTIQEYENNAKCAAERLQGYTREQLENLIREISEVISEHADMLASITAEETGNDCAEVLAAEIRGASICVIDGLKMVQSNDTFRSKDSGGRITVAVIAARGAVSETLRSFLCALTGRTALIICPDARAHCVIGDTVDLIKETLIKNNMPDELIQVIEKCTLENTIDMLHISDAVSDLCGYRLTEK